MRTGLPNRKSKSKHCRRIFFSFFSSYFLLWSLWNIKVTKKLYMFFILHYFHYSQKISVLLERKPLFLYKIKKDVWNAFLLLSYVCLQLIFFYVWLRFSLIRNDFFFYSLWSVVFFCGVCVCWFLLLLLLLQILQLACLISTRN